MRREAEEETATATGRAVRHLTQEPTPLPQVLARRDKADPKTLAVKGGLLITSQPGDKEPYFFSVRDQPTHPTRKAFQLSSFSTDLNEI